MSVPPTTSRKGIIVVLAAASILAACLIAVSIYVSSAPSPPPKYKLSVSVSVYGHDVYVTVGVSAPPTYYYYYYYYYYYTSYYYGAPMVQGLVIAVMDRISNGVPYMYAMESTTAGPGSTVRFTFYNVPDGTYRVKVFMWNDLLSYGKAWWPMSDKYVEEVTVPS